MGIVLGGKQLAALITPLALVACGGDDAGPAITTLPPLPTSTAATSVAPTSSPPGEATSTTSSTTSTTSTTSTPTTTTMPGGGLLVLSAAGLGDATFGVDPEPALEYVRSVLGPPTDDTGWIDAAGPFGSCPGTTVRGVRWGDLLLLFGDESEESTGRLHFFAYVYGPPTGAEPTPSGLATAPGLGLGATVAELQRWYPEVQLYSDPVAGAGFVIEPRLSGNITSTQPDGVVTALYGGISCGE